MSSKSEIIFDGSVDVTRSTVGFVVYSPTAALQGINIGADIPLEHAVLGSWEAVRDDTGSPVVLSATGASPLGIYAPGNFRLNAGRNLGATEKVVLSQ